jgi:predicted AAA+ superfamily ATPase
MEEQIKIALEKQNPWWFNRQYDAGIPRLAFYPLLEKYLRAPEVLLVLGARRTGKSTILYQLISSLKVKPEEILFINLDDPVFQSKSDDPSLLSNLIEERLLENKTASKIYVFIDEVQNYAYWIQTIKTLYDVNKKIKFILSGSTSALLKNTAGARLSGRYFTDIIYPLQFKEYLSFIGAGELPVLEKKSLVKKYLQFGGFPRVALEKDESLKQELLKNYFQTIYLKDIIFPNRIRNNRDIFDLLYFITSNIGVPFSYTNIGKVLGMSTDTVKEYVAYAEQSYLIYALSKYDASVKKQIANPKKIYCIDTGIVNAVSFKFSENRGRLVENLVFLELARSGKEVFYHKEKSECDFLLKDGRSISHAIQVAVSLKDENVKKRELKGLAEAMEVHGLKKGFIITEDEKETLKIKGKTINIIPLYEFLEKPLF